MLLPALPDRLRAAEPRDVEPLLQLVRDLAAYERSAERVVATIDQLHDALFGPDAVAGALVVETDAGRLGGFALHYRTFSTWAGRPGLHLEDLYVVPELRGTGLGGTLMAALASITQHNGYARLSWDCLRWNTPSIEFYEGLGGAQQSEWLTYRLVGESLEKVAARLG